MQISIKCMRLNSMSGQTQKECLGRNSEANFTYQIKENIWSGRGKASRFDHGPAAGLCLQEIKSSEVQYFFHWNNVRVWSDFYVSLFTCFSISESALPSPHCKSGVNCVCLWVCFSKPLLSRASLHCTVPFGGSTLLFIIWLFLQNGECKPQLGCKYKSLHHQIG